MQMRKASSTMIAALVLARKARSGASAQMKICTGKHGRRIGEATGHVDDEGDHADHDERRRLAQCLGHSDDRAGQDARHGERQHVHGSST